MEPMRLTITNYLDVISSWCFWATPAWQELRARYSDQVDFRWKIALMDKTGLPPTHEAMDWYYRRSGMLMRSPVKLQSGWQTIGREEYPEPNCVAEAARALGVEDDRVWIALSRAELLEGRDARSRRAARGRDHAAEVAGEYGPQLARPRARRAID